MTIIQLSLPEQFMVTAAFLLILLDQLKRLFRGSAAHYAE